MQEYSAPENGTC